MNIVVSFAWHYPETCTEKVCACTLQQIVLNTHTHTHAAELSDPHDQNWSANNNGHCKSMTVLLATVQHTHNRIG